MALPLPYSVRQSHFCLCTHYRACPAVVLTLLQTYCCLCSRNANFGKYVEHTALQSMAHVTVQALCIHMLGHCNIRCITRCNDHKRATSDIGTPG